MPAKRFTYTAPLDREYAQVGSISIVRAMLPTQHGQLCHGYLAVLSSSGLS